MGAYIGQAILLVILLALGVLFPPLLHCGKGFQRELPRCQGVPLVTFCFLFLHRKRNSRSKARNSPKYGD